jgi:hypothetical protein
MRLLIYLLALLSGFSAADAARAEVSSASTIAQTAVAAAESLTSQEQQGTVLPANGLVSEEAIPATPETPLAIFAASPVRLHDISRE